MPRAAIYGRYSDDMQRRTSIEDQIRRARETAAAHGFDCPSELVFTDSAITGKREATEKRSGYQRLLRAWDGKQFDALVVDELSRLGRHQLELAQLQERITDTEIRFISAEGIDSQIPGWELSFGITGAVAAHFLQQTRFRVLRGMLGQLERGYMCAAPPFGYRALREGNGQTGGTRWEIVDQEAKWVREIFAMRAAGRALGDIARELNVNGVACPRKPRSGGGGYWRPGTVRQLLANSIYRGLFVWNGSAFTKAKFKKKGKAPPQPKEFERPALRMVDDNIWTACNRSTFSRSGYGGGRFWFSGLATCGLCASTLTATTGRAVPTLYCAQCAQAKRVGVEARGATYASTRGLTRL
jgi:site-specific DNA recombinase